MRVLIIEDDSDIRELFGHVLKARGHSVIYAEDGKEGLTIYLNAINMSPNTFMQHQNKSTPIKKEETKPSVAHPPFDLVILNYNMPLLKGTKVAKEILKLVPGQILFFESATDREILEERLRFELGYIPRIMKKPFLRNDVIKIVEEYEVLI